MARLMRVIVRLVVLLIVLALAAPASGQVIDVRAFFPNPDIARDYWLRAANGLGWVIHNVAGNYDVFSVSEPDGCSVDHYVHFAPEAGNMIAPYAGAWGGEGCSNNPPGIAIGVPPFAATPRLIDLGALPRTFTVRTRSVVVVDATAQLGPWSMTVTISRDGERIKGHYDKGNGAYETLWLGLVPFCDAPWFRVPGLVRYANELGIDGEFCWSRKEN